MKIETPNNKYILITCQETGVEIRVDRTNGGKGRLSNVRVYDADKNLRVNTHITLDGHEVETFQIK